MFTGIVEEVGRVESLRATKSGGILTVRARAVLEGTSLGDSIAVAGACLTVCGTGASTVRFEVMPETLRTTTIGHLSGGARVNLERAMPADGRFGGHLVTGHVHGVARVSGRRREGSAVWLGLSLPRTVSVRPRGSLAVDGVSLTVAQASGGVAWVSLVSHTREATTLGDVRPGGRCNVEADTLAFGAGQPAGEPLGMAFLRAQGF